MLHSFEVPYTRGEYDFSDCRSSRSRRPDRWAPDAVVTTRPPARRSRSRFVSRNGARWLSAKVCSKPSEVCLREANSAPALLASTSTCSWCPRISSASTRTLDISDRSDTCPWTRPPPPAAVASSATNRTRSGSRPTRTTSAPRRVSSIAAARPMPRVAPVSTTTVTQLTLPAPARLACTSWTGERAAGVAPRVPGSVQRKGRRPGAGGIPAAIADLGRAVGAAGLRLYGSWRRSREQLRAGPRRHRLGRSTGRHVQNHVSHPGQRRRDRPKHGPGPRFCVESPDLKGSLATGLHPKASASSSLLTRESLYNANESAGTSDTQSESTARTGRSDAPEIQAKNRTCSSHRIRLKQALTARRRCAVPGRGRVGTRRVRTGFGLLRGGDRVDPCGGGQPLFPLARVLWPVLDGDEEASADRAATVLSVCELLDGLVDRQGHLAPSPCPVVGKRGVVG